MQCESPIRIRNKYTGLWQYVPCNKCDVCRAQKAVARSAALHDYMSRFAMVIMVTLTYDDLHLPFVVNGGSCIYRYHEDFFEQLEVLEESVNLDGCFIMSNFMVRDAAGVLYYRDVQLFFKRFRKSVTFKYGKEFKYFVLGEYGSNPTGTHRPHYHIAFCFAHRVSFEQFRAQVIQNWCLCDWSKLDIEKSFEIANNGCSNYLSSYLAGYLNSNGIFRLKRFEPFCCRSKDLNFGLDNKSGEELRKFVYRRTNNQFSSVGKRYFEYTDTGNVYLPVRTLSAKFLFTYFSKPARYSGLSAGDECRRVREIICAFITRKKVIRQTEFEQYKILNYFDLIGNFNDIRGYYIELSSSDYLCYLSYRRFCDFFELNPFAYGTIDYYSIVFSDVHRYYNSLQLRNYMKRYETIGRTSYLVGAYNTDAHDLDVKLLRFVMRSGLSLNRASCLFDRCNDKADRKQIAEIKQKYGKYLLPKHLNEIYG